jgi:hypothetical protein
VLSDQAKRARNQSRDVAEQSNRKQDIPAVALDSYPAYTVANGVAYPTTAGVFYWVQPQRETGVERSGVTPTFTDFGVPVLAAHIGTVAVPVNTLVLVTPASGRNCFGH